MTDQPRASLPCIKLEPIDQSKLDKVAAAGREKKKVRSCSSDRPARRKQLPPLEIIPDMDADGKEKLLPFNEYKRWLTNLRYNHVKLTPVKPLNQVRCQTATIRRKKKQRSKSMVPATHEDRIFTVTNGEGKQEILRRREKIESPVFFTTSTHEPCGIFDLKALNDALTKPRNKIVPMQQNRRRLVTPSH
jgi:hypothetical protein